MTTACTVVASPQLQEVATRWAAGGLLADSYWIDEEEVQAGLPLAKWQQLSAVHLPTGRKGHWQSELAQIDQLGELVLAWVRQDDEDHVNGMRSAAEFLREAINPKISLKLLDIVVPTELRRYQLPMRPPGWRQLLVAPEDRMDLNAPDAGWSTNRDAVTMHCVAASIGRLGGCHEPLPNPQGFGLEVVTCVSRHVLGGRRARHHAERYLDYELPRATARDVAPTQHEFFKDPWEEVDRATNWLLTSCEGAFDHAAPTPVVPPQVPPRTIAGVEMPFGSSGPAWRRALREFVTGDDTDERAHLDQSGEARYRHPRALEAALLPDLSDELTRAAADPGSIPPAGVWREFVDLATSLSDGGNPPSQYRPVIVHGRRAVVPPELVGPSPWAVEHVWSEEQERELPELEHSPARDVVAHAASTVARELEPASLAVTSEVRGQSVEHLAQYLNARSNEIQGDQISGLEPFRSGTENEPLPFVERMQAKILSEQIQARLDAQRLHDLALSAWPEPNWLQKRVRAGAGFLATVASIISLVWLWWGPKINQWLSQRGSEPLDDWAVYAVTGVLLAVSLVGGYALTLKVIMERDTYWRWRLRARLGLAAEAKRSYSDNSRLVNATRIMSLWCSVLGGILPRRDENVDPSDELPELPLPLGSRIGEPALHAPYARIVAASAAAEPGFRKKILEQVSELILGWYRDTTQSDALGALIADTGYTEGALDRVSRDLLNGSWEKWRDEAVAAITDRVKLKLGSPATPVSGFTVSTVGQVDAQTKGEASFVPGYGHVPQQPTRCVVTTHRWSSGAQQVRPTNEVIFTTGVVVVRLEQEMSQLARPRGREEEHEQVLADEQ